MASSGDATSVFWTRNQRPLIGKRLLRPQCHSPMNNKLGLMDTKHCLTTTLFKFNDRSDQHSGAYSQQQQLLKHSFCHGRQPFLKGSLRGLIAKITIEE